jgi:hypothetical protein
MNIIPFLENYKPTITKNGLNAIEIAGMKSKKNYISFMEVIKIRF